MHTWCLLGLVVNFLSLARIDAIARPPALLHGTITRLLCAALKAIGEMVSGRARLGFKVIRGSVWELSWLFGELMATLRVL